MHQKIVLQDLCSREFFTHDQNVSFLEPELGFPVKAVRKIRLLSSSEAAISAYFCLA